MNCRTASPKNPVERDVAEARTEALETQRRTIILVPRAVQTLLQQREHAGQRRVRINLSHEQALRPQSRIL